MIIDDILIDSLNKTKEEAPIFKILDELNIKVDEVIEDTESGSKYPEQNNIYYLYKKNGIVVSYNYYTKKIANVCIYFDDTKISKFHITNYTTAFDKDTLLNSLKIKFQGYNHRYSSPDTLIGKLSGPNLSIDIEKYSIRFNYSNDLSYVKSYLYAYKNNEKSIKVKNNLVNTYIKKLDEMAKSGELDTLMNDLGINEN